MKSIFVGERKLLLYYLIMMVPLVLLTRPEASYSMVLRIGYFMLLLLPLLQNPQFTPFVILSFYGFSDNACFCFLPDSYLIRFAAVIGLLLMSAEKIRLELKSVRFFLVLYLYALLVSMLYGDTDQLFINTGFWALLLSPFISNEKDVSRLALAFCLMSGALAISYFMNFDYFAMGYGVGEEFERGGWQNLNVLAACVGCGLPLSVAFLVGLIEREKSKLFNWLLIANAIVILLALLSMASRGGAVAAMGSSLLIYLFSSRFKTKHKIWAVFGLILFVFILYRQNYFDILLYRFSDSETTGNIGSRSDIWDAKINAFFLQDFLSQLIGIGRNNTNNLGVFFSTHNDYVTSLIAFGFIGIVLFMTFLMYPILAVRKAGKKDLLLLALFVIMECFVVEPFFRGHFHFWVFYLMLSKMAIINVKEVKNAQKVFSS